jgi:hypothetical protein
MICRLAIGLLAWLTFGAAVPAGRAQGQNPTFRTFTDIVAVDASVKKGKAPVGGLTAADFEVLDNGVVQQIDAVSIEAVPIDVTLVVDLSNSVIKNVHAFKDDIRKFVAMLRPADRVRVVSFAYDVREDVPMQSPASPPNLDGLEVGGATSFNDGLLYAMLWPEEPQRRHLVIAFTDGFDTYSTVGNASLPAIAGRVDVVLHAVLVEPEQKAPASYHGSLDALLDAVRRTGGETHRQSRAVNDFKQIVDDFRASYVLRYTPRGVARGGWHALTVRVTRPGTFTVRARQGYGG